MNKTLSVLLLVGISVVMLSACGNLVNPESPVPTSPAEVPTQPVPTQIPTLPPVVEDLPTLSYSPAVFKDEAAEIELDYPADWTVGPQQQIGERGAQASLLSPGSTAEMLAEGGSRIFLTTYVWDPKNDLDAYIQQRKIAWEASGFQIISENPFKLSDGRDVKIFYISTTDQTQVLFAFTNSGEDYLQLSADGDLELCREIFNTLRAIQ